MLQIEHYSIFLEVDFPEYLVTSRVLAKVINAPAAH